MRRCLPNISQSWDRNANWIKGGDVIGYVGNTGKSTAPHLHYEVHHKDQKIDPINFFFDDLSPEEYNQMLKISSTENQSFD